MSKQWIGNTSKRYKQNAVVSAESVTYSKYFSTIPSQKENINV